MLQYPYIGRGIFLWLKNLILRLLGLDKQIKEFRLQILLQDATIRELAVRLSTLIDQVNYIEVESDIPIYDRGKLRETLKIHYSNLFELQQQAAIYAGTPPMEIINRIQLVELEIDELEKRIKSQ